MNNKKPIVGLIYISIVLLLIIAFGSNYIYQKNKLKQNGVYIIGWRTYSSFGGENGAAYRYKFVFHNISYEVSFRNLSPIIVLKILYYT